MTMKQPLLACLFALLVSASAHANLVTVSFSGVVTEVFFYGTSGRGLNHPGDVIGGTFTYDPSSGQHGANGSVVYTISEFTVGEIAFHFYHNQGETFTIVNDAEHGRFGYSAVFGSDAGNPDLVEGGGFNLFTTSFNGHQPPIRDFETNDFVFGAIFDDPELGANKSVAVYAH